MLCPLFIESLLLSSLPIFHFTNRFQPMPGLLLKPVNPYSETKLVYHVLLPTSLRMGSGIGKKINLRHVRKQPLPPGLVIALAPAQLSQSADALMPESY